MRAGLNHVLVRPDPDNHEFRGFLIGDAFYPERNWSVWGTVVAVGRLWFHPLTNTPLDAVIQEVGLAWETECEVSVGDRVMFRYTARMDDVYEDEEGLLLMIKYDALYMANGVPINGWVIGEAGEPVKVRGIGVANKRYLLFPHIQDGPVGKEVWVHKQRQVRLESEEYAEEHLVRFQRKDILATY